jgi:restriction system protein
MGMFFLGLLLLVAVALLKRPDVRGWLGERITSVGIWSHLDSTTYRRINDVIVPGADGTTQIDHILVSVYGIFVIETKNMKGWIFGASDQNTWTQVLYKEKHKFQNPLRQNYRHTRALSEYLHLDHAVFHSVVWFIGDFTFKTVMPENVLDSGLCAYIERFTSTCLTNGQVDEIEAALRALKNNPVATRGGHIRSLQERHAAGPRERKVRSGKGNHPSTTPSMLLDSAEAPGALLAERYGERWDDLTAAWQVAISRDTCPRCQASPALAIQGAEVHCTKCGAVYPRPTPSSRIPLACPTCGIPVARARPICPKCGLRVRLSRPV